MSKRLWELGEAKEVKREERLESPHALKLAAPASFRALQTVTSTRNQIRNILAGRDSRLLVIAGPCSIHDLDSSVEYAQRFARLAERVQDRVLLVMRVYLQKPRTNVGWTGYLEDPSLDGSGNIRLGLLRSRELLIAINQMGVPCATEFTDVLAQEYISDLISWVAVGARTTESQIHRKVASALPIPLGFKNSTDGSCEAALNAMLSARQPHSFLGIDETGSAAIRKSSGNPDVHVVLRGGKAGPNFGAESIAKVRAALTSPARSILVDCSHDNSGKDFKKQAAVFRSVLEQASPGLLGMMLESHLQEGQQKWSPEAPLRYGVSITDACIGWEETEKLVLDALRAWSKK